ncbi:MAG TPA: hypothetical protein VGX48_01720 [Pyrinomonadaceae bacterium]|jgi:hypothetical protein|nr:hypothetical protein [Pyrinomonadaceae bacterium]
MKAMRLFVLAIFATLTLGAHAALAQTVVTEEDIARQAENTPPSRNWVYYFRTAASTGTFRVGPGTPPSGVGSFEFSTPTGGDKGTLFNYDHVGTELSDIDAIGYSTYRTAGSAQQVAALNIQVDVNGAAPGGFTTLVFEPVYNTNQQSVTSGVWQTWDAYAGGQAIWWSSNPIPSAPNRDTFVTWDTIVEANPDAVIVGGFGINQGSGNPGLTSAADLLTLGYNGETITYDFEPYRVADSKDDCKVGSWQQYKRADGTTFKNQGQCVQYVNNGK